MNKKVQSVYGTCFRFTKYSLAGFLLQCILFNLLVARDTTAQNIYDVKLQLVVNNTSLKDVLKTIEEKTDFTFTYSSRKIDLAKKVSIKDKYASLGKLLEEVARQANLDVKQQGFNILLKPHTEAETQNAFGAIRGRVLDDQLNVGLPGATVLQKGTLNGTTTDLNGEFFLRAPVGEIELEISYIGFQKISQVVSITDGTTASIELKMRSDVTELSGVIVTGSLQGQQKALNQQKNADNIKNIVSADQIGRFPDPNVAEALQRVPAVNIERDQGEGRYVLIRGLAPQFTNISINGEQIPSPEADVRYVALDAIPADQLASIEVSLGTFDGFDALLFVQTERAFFLLFLGV